MTYGNYMVIIAEVTSAGSPVGGSMVTFADSAHSPFQGSSQTTNASGIAATVVEFLGSGVGADNITATATAQGYSAGNGSSMVTVTTYSATQLTVTASIVNAKTNGGSSDIIYGLVRSSGYSADVSNAQVTISDALRSEFVPNSTQTNSGGAFSIDFTVGNSTSLDYDIITVTTQDPGYGGSTSTVLMQVQPSSQNFLRVVFGASYPSSGVAVGNEMVLEVKLTAGSGGSSSPVAGGSVKFTDTYGGAFSPGIATTNSSGIALTTALFTNGNVGDDYVTATATSGESGSGVGSTIVNVLPYGPNDLSITATIANTLTASGSSDIIYGLVRSSGYTSDVSGVTVSVKDTIGSAFPRTSVQTSANGMYSLNFTLGKVAHETTDIITVTANLVPYSGSASSLPMNVTPENSTNLSVALNAFYPSSTTTYGDDMVVRATVTRGGVPVQGATVAFSDKFQFTFQGASEPTDADGVATTILEINQGSTGYDIVTATATADSYDEGTASNLVVVVPYSPTQLDISEAVNVSSASAGELVNASGNVRDNGGGPFVAGAMVTFSDSLESTFTPSSVETNSNGFYSSILTVGRPNSTTDDIITVTVTSPGYAGSSSSIYILAISQGVTTSLNSSSSSTSSSSTHSSTTSSSSSSSAGPSSSTASSSTALSSSSGLNLTDLLTVVLIAIGIVTIVVIVLVYRKQAQTEEMHREPKFTASTETDPVTGVVTVNVRNERDEPALNVAIHLSYRVRNERKTMNVGPIDRLVKGKVTAITLKDRRIDVESLQGTVDFEHVIQEKPERKVGVPITFAKSTGTP